MPHVSPRNPLFRRRGKGYIAGANILLTADSALSPPPHRTLTAEEFEEGRYIGFANAGGACEVTTEGQRPNTRHRLLQVPTHPRRPRPALSQ